MDLEFFCCWFGFGFGFFLVGRGGLRGFLGFFCWFVSGFVLGFFQGGPDIF